MKAKTHTLDRIKNISMKLFNEQGYERTSLKKIFDTIGITAPSFYHYYRSKKDLYIDLLHMSQNDNKKYILRRIEKSKDLPLEERWYLLFESFVKYALKNKEKSTFIFLASLFPTYELRSEIQEDMQKWIVSYLDWLMNLILEGQNSGVFISDIEPKVIGSRFFYLVIGIVYDVHFESKFNKIEDAKPYFDIFYKGILSTPQSSHQNNPF